MNNKVVITYDILGTGVNKTVFTFDEATEAENKEKFSSAMAITFGTILEATMKLRELQINGIEIEGDGARFVLKQGAGEKNITVEIVKGKGKETNNER